MSDIASLMGPSTTGSGHGPKKKGKKKPHFGSSSTGSDSYHSSGGAPSKGGLAKAAAVIAGVVLAFKKRSALKEFLGKLIKNPKDALAMLKKGTEQVVEKVAGEVKETVA